MVCVSAADGSVRANTYVITKGGKNRKDGKKPSLDDFIYTFAGSKANLPDATAACALFSNPAPAFCIIGFNDSISSRRFSLPIPFSSNSLAFDIHLSIRKSRFLLSQM